MILAGSSVTIFAIFLTAILLGGGSEKNDPMLARFAQMRRKIHEDARSRPDSLLRTTREPEPGWKQLLLARFAATLKLKLLFQQAASSVTAEKFLLQSFCAGLLLFIATLAFFPVRTIAFLAALCGGLVPWLILNIRRKRRIAAFAKALPAVTETISRSLRAGNSLTAAISVVGDQAPEPARAEFAEIFHQLSFGLSLREALLQLLDRVPSQDLRVLVASILVQKDTGGDLTKILDQTSEVIRERQKLAGDIQVHTAQGRMTGWILCLLPVFMFVAINLINPGYFQILTGTPIGHKILIAGAVLLSVGAFLIKRIVGGIDI